ncbi:MAG: tetratricopeptide repeat protein [Acidimicrobiales bacterium]
MTDDQRARLLEAALPSRVSNVTVDASLAEVASQSSHPVIQAAGLAHQAYGDLLSLECGRAESLLRAATRMIADSKSTDYPILRWFAYHALADCLDERGLFDEALEQLEEALDIANEFHLVAQWGRSCAGLVFLQRRLGNGARAAEAVELLLTSEATRDRSTPPIDRVRPVPLA